MLSHKYSHTALLCGGFRIETKVEKIIA